MGDPQSTSIKTLHLEAEGYILRDTQLLDVKGVPK